jgi:phosphogluconate dehydratase
VTAPAVVFDDQHDFLEAFGHGQLDGRDFVAVIRYQGPAANGMPELHKLTPSLGVLQDRGQKVAIVTDGRMSGASGKVPAAIHVTPEAALGGPLSRIQDGDVITVDADGGLLGLHVDHETFARRPITGRAPQGAEWAGTGRELFAAFRATVGSADTGASVFPGVTAPGQEVRLVQPV